MNPRVKIHNFFLLLLFTEVLIAHASPLGNHLLCATRGNEVSLNSNRFFYEQVTLPNTKYKISHDFSLRQRFTCELTVKFSNRGESLFRSKEPINLIANQTIWLPEGCVLLDSSFIKLPVEYGRFTPIDSMGVFLAGKDMMREQSYEVAGYVVIPEGCTLSFAGGSLRDGIICGTKTVLKYNEPFLSNVHLTGDWISTQDVYDENVFMDNTYSWNRIQSCFRISSPSNKVMFSNNTYENMRTIAVERDIIVDFGGSVFYMALDKTGLPCSFLMTEPSSDRSPETNRLSCVSISNATIVGNPVYKYNGTAVPGFSGKYRRAIQLFKVASVSIANVTLSNYVVGTNNSPSGLPPAGVNRFINSAIVVWGYDRCYLNGIEIHDCHADNLIKLVPNVNTENEAILKNCHSYKNFTGLLAIYDGRIDCYDNVVEDYNSSALNLFCYDSYIHNNTFVGSNRSVAIDLSEDGAYQSQRVRVYDNEVQTSYGGLVDICGKDIIIINNTISGSGEGETAMYLSVPKATGFEIGAQRNNVLFDGDLTGIHIKGNKASDYAMFLRTVQSSSVIASKSDMRYEEIFIDGNSFDGMVVKRSLGGLIYLPPVERIHIRNNAFSGSNLAIGTSGWSSVITVQSSLCSDYYYPEITIELKNNVIDCPVVNPKNDVLLRIHAAKSNAPERHLRVVLDAKGNIGKNQLNSIISVSPHVKDYDVLVIKEENQNIPVKSIERIEVNSR